MELVKHIFFCHFITFRLFRKIENRDY